MTEYGYDNLPAGDEMVAVEPVPEDLFTEALMVLGEAIARDRVYAQEAKLAHVYDRKGFMYADTFGGDRNRSYGTDGDVVLQITVRVPRSAAGLDELHRAVKGKRNEARRAELEEALADAERRAAEAQGVAYDLLRKLKGLGA
jgi:hypothetical protein